MQRCPQAAQYVAQHRLPHVSWEHVQTGLFGVEGRGEATAPPGTSAAPYTWMWQLSVTDAFLGASACAGIAFVMLCDEFVGCCLDVHNRLLELSTLEASLVESVLSHL